MGADRYHTCRRQVGWGPWPTSKGAVSHPPANGCRGWPEFLIEGGKADLNADFLKLRITVRVRPSKSMGCARPLKILENRKKKKKSEDNNQASSATRVGILVFESSCLEKFHPRFFFFFFNLPLCLSTFFINLRFSDTITWHHMALAKGIAGD